MPLPRALLPPRRRRCWRRCSACGPSFPTPLQTHLSENREEIARVKQLWPEHAHYLDVYHHYQLTGERSVFAHGSILMMPSGSACMTPVPQSPSVRPRICFSAAGCFACPPAGSTSADGYRQRRRGRDHLQHAADAGRGLQGRTTAELSPARQRGLLSRHPRRRAPCGWKRRLAIFSRAKRPTLW